MAKEARRTVEMMGTSIDLMVVHETPEPVLDEMVEQLHKYERRFSANDPSSELEKVNQKAGLEPVKVHPELFELIEMGKKHSVPAESFLNIAVGPLSQTWRIGFEDARVPTEEEIQRILPLTNPREIVLDSENSSVFLTQKGMKIDLGALAKGYIADRLVEYLQKVQAKSALINLGGNLVTFGPALKRPDKLWRIGIQDPTAKRGESQIILKLGRKSIVTSGIYERLLEVNGDTYHHIFNPKTGYPIETSLASLTIVSDLSVDGEMWTTRLFGHTPERILEIVNKNEAIEALIITKEGTLLASEGLRDLIIR